MGEVNLIKKKEWGKIRTIIRQSKRTDKKIDDLPFEKWYDIPNYEGLYQLSNFYRVKSCCKWGEDIKQVGVKKLFSERLLSPSKPNGKYWHFCFSKNGIKKTELFHRIIASVFIPNPHNKPCVNHKNGIKWDNRIENLEWNTESENSLHSCRVLGMGVGEKHGLSSLPYSVICEIRDNYKPHKYNSKELCSKYGVSKITMSRIINRKTRVNA